MSCNFSLGSIRPIFTLAFLFVFLLTSYSFALEKPDRQSSDAVQLLGGPINGFSKAAGDSFLIMGPWGSGALYNGQFQAAEYSGLTSAWNGWTSHDNSASGLDYWHADTYNAANLNGHGAGNLAAWCGSMDFSPCESGALDGGYGNNMIEKLIWKAEVADPSQPSQVTIDAWFNYNLEVDYDNVAFGCLVAGNESQITMLELDGIGENVHLQETFTYQPGDYIGELGNTVFMEIRIISDGAYSDEDCNYDSNGAIQIDDITMSVDNGGIVYFEDFEDGSLGSWEVISTVSVGDFASIRSGLEDVDYCSTNYSCQVNFIDDGIVVPGTGGSLCQTWCYGPGGYVVNSTGGLAGPDYHLDNSVLSPVMPWPEDNANGGLFEFDVYQHEPLGIDSPGIFTYWDVRSTSSSDPADIENATWESQNYIYYGNNYSRSQYNISHLLEQESKFVQLRLSVVEYGYNWGWYNNDATPAPYYDNVRLTAYDLGGPTMIAMEWGLANDGFPANGILDAENLGNNSVRFDMAKNIAIGDLSAVDFGDTLVIEVNPGRDGAVLAGMPVMHYRVKPNTLFDPYRTTGLPLVGEVDGRNVTVDGGLIIDNRFCFDLPDTGFFFPGDVMHYYFTATDEVSGTDFQTSILPADTLGFSSFVDVINYDQSYTFRALPTLIMDGDILASNSGILLWDDMYHDSARDRWHLAMKQALGAYSVGYDVYYTNSASSNMQNGLGYKATAAQLAVYDVIVYGSGSMANPNLGHVADVTDETPSIDVLDAWLRQGGKSMFLAGDNIVSYLPNSSQGAAFVNYWMGVERTTADVRPMISGQSTPTVGTLYGNPLFFNTESWIAYGGCPGVNTFDGVANVNGGVRVAEFKNPDGSPAYYPFSAATMKEVPEFDSVVLSLPYDLSFVWEDPNVSKANGSMSTRALILRRFVEYGYASPWFPVPAPDAQSFTVHNYPNPFNPKTRIEYNMPQAGQLKIQIFNIRGELVRVLMDEVQSQGSGFVMWDGTNGKGNPVSTGVYFYEARAGEKIEVGKMSLVK